MSRRTEPSAAAVDALHLAVAQAGENVSVARRLLQERDPDAATLAALLRRAVPRPFLEALALTPPWSRDARVLAAVVLSPQALPRLSVPLLPALFWHDLAEVARTLRVAAPVRARAEAVLMERLPDLRLGERISLGRMATPPVLRSLLRAGEARVTEACLFNPRLREDDLVTVLRAADVPVVLLEATARSRKWSESYAVRLELALQPRTPLALALAQLTSLVRRDLVRVSRAEGLRPLVREAALRAAEGAPDADEGRSKSRGIRQID